MLNLIKHCIFYSIFLCDMYFHAFLNSTQLSKQHAQLESIQVESPESFALLHVLQYIFMTYIVLYIALYFIYNVVLQGSSLCGCEFVL